MKNNSGYRNVAKATEAAGTWTVAENTDEKRCEDADDDGVLHFR